MCIEFSGIPVSSHELSLAADDVGDASSRGVPIGVPKLQRYAALAQLAAGWRDVPSAGLMQNSADAGGG